MNIYSATFQGEAVRKIWLGTGCQFIPKQPFKGRHAVENMKRSITWTSTGRGVMEQLYKDIMGKRINARAPF